jgi:hypothetical protein
LGHFYYYSRPLIGIKLHLTNFNNPSLQWNIAQRILPKKIINCLISLLKFVYQSYNTLAKKHLIWYRKSNKFWGRLSVFATLIVKILMHLQPCISKAIRRFKPALFCQKHKSCLVQKHLLNIHENYLANPFACNGESMQCRRPLALHRYIADPARKQNDSARRCELGRDSVETINSSCADIKKRAHKCMWTRFACPPTSSSA